jgi:O-antigen/teichoic acid export membrane protein
MKTTFDRWTKDGGTLITPGRAPALVRVADRLSEHVRVPVFRNGYALLFSGAATSGLGLLYWVVAARLYPAAIVGLNSALLSAMILLSGMAQLSLNNVLVRFIPAAGRDTRALILWSYLASGLTAVLLSVVFVIGVDNWSPALQFLRSEPAWLWSFVMATVAWSVFSLQDSALTGLRQAVWVPVENTLFAILKILLLAMLAASLKQAGIFASWTVPVALSLLPVNWLIFRRFMPLPGAAKAQPDGGIERREILRFVAGNYLGTALFLAYTNLLPILVANRSGPAANAYFYLPWMIAGGLQLIAINMTTSMTVEAALDRTQLRVLSQRVLKQTLRLLSPLVIGLVVGAPWLLQLFGPTYSFEGAALMRWLAAAALPNVLVVLAISIARVTNRSWLVVAINASVCVVTLVIAYSLLPRYGIVAVGWAWLGSQVAVALVLAATVLRSTLRSGSRA